MIDRERVARAVRRRYDVGELLGEGGFGKVFAGRHRSLDREVAIKAVEADGLSISQEARMLAQLSHPHIVQIYDYEEVDGLHLIIMEMLPGGTLTSRLRDLSRLDVCAVALAQAAALQHAHDRGFLHRDNKPDNTLLDATNLPKVTDLGLAKIFAGSTPASRVVGTPPYMALEQLMGGELSRATDVYAIAACLYQGLCGKLPFASRDAEQRRLAPPELPETVPGIIADVVVRALAGDPLRRHKTAQEFALDLAAAAARAYGPKWTAASGIKLRLDDEVREAATRSHAW